MAVNNQGLALTTLPYDPSASGYGYDIAISFNVDSPSFSAPLGYDGSAAISSRGMTTESRGDFLIATGQQGSVYTQDVPGVVVLDANVSHPTAVALPYFDTMQDVTVSPDDSTLYMVLPQGAPTDSGTRHRQRRSTRSSLGSDARHFGGWDCDAKGGRPGSAAVPAASGRTWVVEIAARREDVLGARPSRPHQDVLGARPSRPHQDVLGARPSRPHPAGLSRVGASRHVNRSRR